MATEASSLLAEKPIDSSWFFQSPARLWFGLIACSCATILGQLPSIAWQQLYELMLDEGIYQCDDTREQAVYGLDSIANVGYGVTAIANLFGGSILDTFGPRSLGIASAICSAMGFVVIGVSLLNPCTPGLIWMVLLSFAAAPVTSISCYSYMYLIPGHELVASAIINGAFPLAMAVGLLADALHRNAGMLGSTFFFAVAGCMLVSVPVFFYALPSSDAYLRISGKTPCKTGTSGESQEKQTAAEKPEVATTATANTSGAPTSIAYSHGLIVFIAHFFALYMVQQVFLIEQYHYYASVFGSEHADHGVRVYSIIFAAAALPVSLSFGLASARLPPVTSSLLCDALLVGFFCTVLVRTNATQYAAMVFFVCLTNVFYVALPPLIVLYSPRSHFGILYGAVMAAYGLLQMLLVEVQDGVAVALVPDTGDLDDENTRFLGKLTFWMVLAVFAGAANWLVWRVERPFAPDVGTATRAP